MAQAQLIRSDGSRGTPRGFGMPKKLNTTTVFKAAKKALGRDIGSGWRDLQFRSVVVDEACLQYGLVGGGQIIVDRKANAIGR